MSENVTVKEAYQYDLALIHKVYDGEKCIDFIFGARRAEDAYELLFYDGTTKLRRGDDLLRIELKAESA